MPDAFVVGIIIGYIIVMVCAILCLVHVHKTLPPSLYSKGLKISFVLKIFQVTIGCIQTIVFPPTNNTLTDTHEGFMYSLIAAIFESVLVIDYTIFGFTQLEFLKSFSPHDEMVSLRIVKIGQAIFGLVGVSSLGATIASFVEFDLMPLCVILLQLSIGLIQVFDVVINTYLLYFVFLKLKKTQDDGRYRLAFAITWIAIMANYLINIIMMYGTQSQDNKKFVLMSILIHIYTVLSYLCMVCIRQMLALRQKRKRQPPNKDQKPVINPHSATIKHNATDGINESNMMNEPKNKMDDVSLSPITYMAQDVPSKVIRYPPSSNPGGYEPPPNTFLQQ